MYRVLIVDDEMPALRFVQSIIERFSKNFQVAGVATSGEQGFQLLEQQMFDLLITDIGMRGMNGIELAQAARAMQPNIRIVIISGYGKFEYAQGAIQAGVDDYLLKPVSISKMTAILENLEKKLDANQSDLNATLLPAIAWADMGRWSFVPAAGGFWLGVLFLRLLERLLPAAAADPAVLLLDEITANLDAETERAVLRALKRATADRTVLSISHRVGADTGRLIPIGEES